MRYLFSLVFSSIIYGRRFFLVLDLEKAILSFPAFFMSSSCYYDSSFGLLFLLKLTGRLDGGLEAANAGLFLVSVYFIGLFSCIWIELLTYLSI